MTDAEQLERIAAVVRTVIDREYPSKIGHVLFSAEDALPPRALTPVFFGCFDWHSAVHAHWTLARLLRVKAAPALRARLHAALASSLTADRVAGELAYLRPRPSFEMPYGAAWLLRLDAELAAAALPFRPALAPLVELVRERFVEWLERLPCPIRSGEHSQSAFAMTLAFDAAQELDDRPMIDLLIKRATDFYLGDRHAPINYEPSAYDFLSPALAEADLMRRVLPTNDFLRWLEDFLPLDENTFTPVSCAAPADGKLAHADGLNLSRAWMLRDIARLLGSPDRARRVAALAHAHAAASLPAARGANYEGTHWLGTFAVYWLTDPSRPAQQA